MKTIGYIESDFKTKFGIPRQSGLVESKARVVLIPPYNLEDAVRGLEEYSHIWLIWEFSENIREDDSWSATVRPPRLGGNERKGVFATRSPFRPNPIGLSCVKLEEVAIEKEGPVLYVTGADLMNGTPIYDIKPYVAFSDSHSEAKGGFADKVRDYHVEVVFPDDLSESVSLENRELLKKILAEDPRPSYHDDPERVYGMEYADLEVKFKVSGKVLTVTEVSSK